MKYSPSEYRFVAEVLHFLSQVEPRDYVASRYWVDSKEVSQIAGDMEDEAAITASVDELHWN